VVVSTVAVVDQTTVADWVVCFGKHTRLLAWRTRVCRGDDFTKQPASLWYSPVHYTAGVRVRS
jgi:hypothetical protein